MSPHRRCAAWVVAFEVDQPVRSTRCGWGPTAENTHQIVQRANRDVVVVYVDNDPVVLAHGRALLQDAENVEMIEADIFQPRQVLGRPTVQRRLDFSRPLALLQVGTLHHLEGDAGPAMMRRYIDALASK